MWLLDTTTLALAKIVDDGWEKAQGSAAPPLQQYGILSHRWENSTEEPTFEELRTDRGNSDKKGGISAKKGGVKLINCCSVAKSDGLELLWSDTCCIDKSSSAELQEGINSMYRYYESAHICYAYLRDVSIETFEDDFGNSEWFTRGWTLQELLAPPDLRFYDRDWKYLGDKKALCHPISIATGIQAEVLIGSKDIQECSVAQRMSWAVGRRTSRVEDRAYSLLGIFDVNMTMLYGEGPKSFLRLQEEIIRTLDDHSIFAWKGVQSGLPGLLAASPEAFASSREVRNIRARTERRSYVVNNRGLSGLVPLIPYTLDTYLTLLPCTYSDPSDESTPIGIFLRRLYEDDQFMRVSVAGQDLIPNAKSLVMQHGFNRMVLARNISVRQRPFVQKEHAEYDFYTERIQGFRLNADLLKEDAHSGPQYSISGDWHSQDRTMSLLPGSRRIHHVGDINIGAQKKEIEVVRLGFDYDYNPVVFLTNEGVRYSEEEDERGVFKQNFSSPSDGPQITALLLSGENFQNALPAIGGHWSRYTPLPDGTCLAQMSADVDGFWALKADRHDGLDVHISRATQRSSMNDKDNHIGRLRLHRVVIGGHLVWDLQLDQLAPRRQRQNDDVVRSSRKDVGGRILKDMREVARRADRLAVEGTHS